MGDFALTEGRKERGGKAVHLIAVRGDLDAQSFPQLQGRLERLIAEDGRAIVLDCRELDSASSAAMLVLSKTIDEIRAGRGDIRLAGPPERIQNLLTLLGLARKIQIFSSVDEAVASY